MQWPLELKEELKAGMQPLIPTPAYSEDDIVDFVLEEYAKATVFRAGGILENMQWAPESLPTTIGAIVPGVLLEEGLASTVGGNERWHPALQMLFAYTREHAGEICDTYRDIPSKWSKAIQENALEFWEEGKE